MYKMKTRIYMGFIFANVPYNNRQPRKFLWLTKLTYIHTHFQVCINHRQARTMQAEVCYYTRLVLLMEMEVIVPIIFPSE